MDELTIYLLSGETYRFYNVIDFTKNEDTLTFSYQSKGDGKTKSAVFYVRHIAGQSTIGGING